jgi:integrase/recombinase XerD
LRSFFNYLYENKIIKNNPVKNLKLPKKVLKTPTILSDFEINKLIYSPIYKGLKGDRDKTIMMLLCSLGLRVSELININVDDFNFENGFLVCKNNKDERILTLNDDLKNHLEIYLLNIRTKITNTYDLQKAFFLNLNGTRLSRQGCWKIVKSYKEKADISTELTPHRLTISLISSVFGPMCRDANTSGC